MTDIVDYIEMEPAEPTPSNFMHYLPVILRWLGGAALVFAMYSFMLKGWQGGNDELRYLLTLGNTGVLAMAGFVGGHWLKEGKGARLLLTMGLISVAMNFSILGAFIYSAPMSLDAAAYPHYVTWAVEGLDTALQLALSSMAVIIPVTLLGFAVLARSYSKRLSAIFMLNNAALLLPFRESGSIALMVIVLAVITLLGTRRSSSGNAALKTREGIMALSLLMLPLGILLGRNIWLYSANQMLFTIISLSIFFMLRQFTLFLESGSMARNRLDLLSFIPALGITFQLTTLLNSVQLIPAAMILPISSLGSAFMLYDIAKRNDRFAHYSYAMVALLLSVSTLYNLFIMPGFTSAAMSTVIGIGLTVMGYRKQIMSLFMGGLLMFAVGTLQQFYTLFHQFELGSWATMAILGIVSILIGSVIESRGSLLKNKLMVLRSHFQN